MSKVGLDSIYSVSLKYKILFAFLFSIIPMLAIVAITYYPARDSALEGSHRQITLISSSGAEQLNATFDSGAVTFSAWTEEDVFGMAIEFDAIGELQKHFNTMQTDNPEFTLLLITDIAGNILGEGRSSRIKNNSTGPLAGTNVEEVDTMKRNPGTPVLVVSGSPVSIEKDQSAMFLYWFRTADSEGKQNGYFLAYLDPDKLNTLVHSIALELKKSGFASNRVRVVDAATEKTIASPQKGMTEGDQQLKTPLQTVLQKSTAGEIKSFTTKNQTEHIIFFPLRVFQRFTTTTTFFRNEVNLFLLVSVDEDEIMVEVRKTLILSGIIAGLGLLTIIILGLLTVRTITKPIGNLVRVLQQYAAGDSNVRAEVKSHDEIGYFTNEFNTMLEQVNSSGKALQESEATFRVLFEGLQEAVSSKNYQFRFIPESRGDDLPISLNKMLETLESAANRTNDEDWLKTGLTSLSEKISGEHQLDDLCENAITFIAGYTGVQVGTIFVKNRDDRHDADSYELIASYAFRMRKGLSNRYTKGEGLIGQAAQEKEIILFTDIPEDYIKIESSLGLATPANIIVIPLMYEGDVKGIIELGASFPLSQRLITFMEHVSSVVAVAINAAIANDRLKVLLEQTRNQSETLKTQQKDLQKANEELEEQTEILQESEARLQLQQEELQTSNEEMEEKNQLLEEQKKENEEKNRNLQEKQREIEEKAKQLELATKYKSEFLSNMSHELRTPLNSILLLAKMLSENDEKNLSEDQVESAASIHRGGQTLLHLINDILDLSKIEAGRVELNISGICPANIQADFELEFNHLAKRKGLDFKTELEEGLPETIVTDVYRMEQILRNLLGNSFKFTEHGSVTLSIARPGPEANIYRNDLDIQNTIQLSVTDTGPGIPKDKLNQIFEAFRQVDGSISRRHGGTGLGLSISKELASLIGGEISVESSIDQGAIFSLYIPQTLTSADNIQRDKEQQIVSTPAERTRAEISKAALQAEENVTIPASPDTIELSLAAKRMLIIEDDPEFSTILLKFFQKNGYDTNIAPTGEKGIKYAIEHNPTAIVLDIGLPGIDGWTVLRELKNNPDTRHIPVHIMSAYDEYYEGLQKGAVGYLTKPVSIGGLRSALGKFEHVLENTVKELLVVEDDRELRNNILKLMGTQDISATTAETGKKAMEFLRTNRFDCMILDLGLPDISGFTLLDEIEQDTSIKRLPVIIYTGRDLTIEETQRLEKYSSSIVLKNAFSMERLLDETALFMHRVEQDMPESHRKIIEEIREKDSSIRGKKVLLVDDDMRNAFALSKFLKHKGLNVTIADNGKKALELLESETMPDIVLMDIMMPVMDGYETMKIIRKNQEFKDIPILALTAKALDTDRDECIRCGANDYLSKPIDTKKLLSMLRVWMY